jgi:hypothetical protein
MHEGGGGSLSIAEQELLVATLYADPVWVVHNYTLHTESFPFGVQSLPPELVATPC